MTKNELIQKLSPRSFWDVYMSKLDYKNDRDFIIERIVVYETEKDEKLLYKIYSWRTIRNSVIKSDCLNDTIINYLSLILDIKRERFKCYGKIPSQYFI